MISKPKATRVDSAYERLKAEILKGDLPPGFQAPEPDYADRLGMSRTPVREALIRLEAEGLIDLVPRRGARVLAVSRQDIKEIYEMLAVLEGLAAEQAVLSDEVDVLVAAMQETLRHAENALALNDIEIWALNDDSFHRLVARGSGNRRLEQEIASLLNQVYRANMVLLRLNKAPAATHVGHEDIVAAIASGDPVQAFTLARRHRQNGLETMSRLLESSGLSFV
ncbi:GntR family transcriptional regulator [Roseibium denhamense]|uniref:Transcriptional regulator, GntR family n=1 Tax=Roseibium denhamense TaxID=76305 RepID=A0ABY1NHY2_9HYPH|nr:GntR family transcriptional regulator [Roseibium denhamense]MTI05086.1 GntR family transcriptional regulator [Roseibium denhamense]SMP10287.1 transcriptional regulator, GntR family [Roseibium denhamense]